jgi:hypothetical protein
VSLAVAIAGLLWCEHMSRAHQQLPSVIDDPVLWGMIRARADGSGSVVALVGTSRMELAYDPSEFERVAPSLRGVQLAIDGIPGFGVLEDLAQDPDFHGVVVCDLAEWDLARDDAFTAAELWVRRAHALWRAPGQVVNRYVASLVQSELAILSIGGRRLIAGIGHRSWPDPTWGISQRDRTRAGYYDLAPAAQLAQKEEKAIVLAQRPDLPPELWLAKVPRIEAAVRALEAHGAAVLFLRLPTSGDLDIAYAHAYPRQLYWDQLAARLTAPVVNFHDVPRLAALRCPDNNHLDVSERAAFTDALVGLLRDRGVLAGRE